MGWRNEMEEEFDNAHEADEWSLMLTLALKGLAYAMLDVSASVDALHQTVRDMKETMDRIEVRT